MGMLLGGMFGGGGGGNTGTSMYTGASNYPAYQQRYIPPPAPPMATQPTQPVLPQPSATNPAVLQTSSVGNVGSVTGGSGLETKKPAGGMAIGV